MLDVLYDVTNLGLSFGTELTRTGIFRVSESFVREVVHHAELTPRFAALQSFVGEVQLARFDRSARGLLGERWMSAWTNPAATLEEAMAVADAVLATGEAGDEGRRLRASLMLLNRTARPRALGAFDVYHSLRSPLVPSDRVQARARAATIYDMVPFLFPELTEDAFVDQLRMVVNSIDRGRDWIICNSLCTRADICHLMSMSPDRVFVVPLAAAREVFRPERDQARIAAVLDRYGIPHRGYVLSLCTLEPRKNLARLVRAFFALVEDQRLHELRLVLVGATGWKSRALFAALDERPRLRERVILPGFVPDEDLGALYSGARAFVYPSLYEGFGLPVLEAMQCGVPVITSRTSSLPEVVGPDAITVDPVDDDALAQAMLDVLRDPERAAELGRRGLERSRLFSWSRTVEETIRAYGAMLGA